MLQYISFPAVVRNPPAIFCRFLQIRRPFSDILLLKGTRKSYRNSRWFCLYFSSRFNNAFSSFLAIRPRIFLFCSRPRVTQVPHTSLRTLLLHLFLKIFFPAESSGCALHSFYRGNCTDCDSTGFLFLPCSSAGTAQDVHCIPRVHPQNDRPQSHGRGSASR